MLLPLQDYNVFPKTVPGAPIVLGAVQRVASEFTRGTHGEDARLRPRGFFGNRFRHLPKWQRRAAGKFEQWGGPDKEAVVQYILLLRTLCWISVKTIPVMPLFASKDSIEAVTGAVRDALVSAANAGNFHDGVLSIHVNELNVKVERRG